MASLTLQPFDARTARNRSIAPTSAQAQVQASFWKTLATNYWLGWEHYARTYDDAWATPAELAPGPAPAAAAPVAPAIEAQPVVRVWRGQVRPEHADAFHRYVQTLGAPSYRRARGNLGVWVLRRPLATTT